MNASFSKGGNLTCSISDHLMQFSQINIFDRIKVPKTAKFARNWRIFNKNEFKEELFKIDINPIFNPLVGTDESFDFFYEKTEKLLDEMAPLKKLSKKEIGLKQSPDYFRTNYFHER